jgi:hypothetical protein
MAKRPPDARTLAAEIVRRGGVGAGNSQVVRVSDPPTAAEQLRLLAARLERTPIVIVPHKCANMEEWVERYAIPRRQIGAPA